MRVDGPAWFAARIDSTSKNELDQPLFAHTSPVYVAMGGKGVFDIDAARGLLQQVEEAQAAIRAQGRFRTPDAAARLLARYDEAAADLRARINRERN